MMFSRSILVALVLAATTPMYAQSVAPWRFGAMAAASLNVSGVGYAAWGPDGGTNPGRNAGQFTTDVGIDGTAVMPYVAFLAEYTSASWWGLHARLSYDDRSLSAVDDLSYSVGGRYIRDVFDLSARYLTLDPRLRIAPAAHSPLAFTFGLGASVALQQRVTYTADGASEGVTFAIPEARPLTLSLNLGLTYDIPISSERASTRYTVMPFVDAAWIMSQRGPDPGASSASNNALQSLSARIGIAVTRGKVDEDSHTPDHDEDDFFIRVTPPDYGEGTQVVAAEHMPLIPSVFLAPTDKRFPPRYRKRKLKSIDSASSYYDVISVAAGLLNAYPSLTLTLVGSDPVDGDGLGLARQVREAILDLAFVDTSRIVLRGQREPSVVTGTTSLAGAEYDAAVQENRRVDLICGDPSKWPMVVSVIKRDALIESNMVVRVYTKSALQPWFVNITADDLPDGRTFGPFDGNQAVIPASLIPKGPSRVISVGVAAQGVDGASLTDTRRVSLPSDPPSNVGSERHVLLMAYGEVDPSKRWKSYIDGTLSERLRDGCKIIVHGHTDDIGVAEVNRKLSHQHAERVAALLQDAIGRKGVDNVDLVFVGHGEDPFDAPLRQESPEGRQYNRSVIIDIVYP
jgi:hypothetical protein